MKLSTLYKALGLLSVATVSNGFNNAFVGNTPSASTFSYRQTTMTTTSINNDYRAMMTTTTRLYVESSDNDDDDNASRIEGNRRPPTANEIAVMDDMISKLAIAKAYELPNAVSKAIRVISSPRFFLRIAERADMATKDDEKERLSALAENLVSTLEAVVSTTEDRLDERAMEVEKVLKAASEPSTGEFMVPLSSERVDAMRETLSNLDPSSLDEGFLATVDAWMNKSMQDGMDGMVSILQKVLQIYAGTDIARARTQLTTRVGAAVTGKEIDEVAKIVEEEQTKENPRAVLLEQLLAMDTDDWGVTLKKEFEKGEVTPAGILGEVQRTIEGVVLGLENGSMAQRVQAEFLRELVSRIETTQKEMGL